MQIIGQRATDLKYCVIFTLLPHWSSILIFFSFSSSFRRFQQSDVGCSRWSIWWEPNAIISNSFFIFRFAAAAEHWAQAVVSHDRFLLSSSARFCCMFIFFLFNFQCHRCVDDRVWSVAHQSVGECNLLLLSVALCNVNWVLPQFSQRTEMSDWEEWKRLTICWNVALCKQTASFMAVFFFLFVGGKNMWKLNCAGLV